MVFISKRCVSFISLFHTCGFAQCCAGAVGETQVKVSGHWARVFPSLPLQTATTLCSWHVQQRHALVQDLHDCQRCQHQICPGLQSVLVLQGGHWQSVPCFKPQAYSYCSGRKWEKSCVRLSVCLSSCIRELLCRPPLPPWVSLARAVLDFQLGWETRCSSGGLEKCATLLVTRTLHLFFVFRFDPQWSYLSSSRRVPDS